MTGPFSLPRELDSSLAPVLSFWEGLKRGQADIPFSDDVQLSALKDPDSSLLLDVQGKPLRFRVAIAGKAVIARRGGEGLEGLYLDEMAARPPLHFLLSQASATVEARAPTYFSDASSARLVLPLWGDGRISMLLAAVSRGRG